MKTSDGGESWVSTGLSDLVDFLIDVHFFDEDRGVAAGGSLDGRAAVIGTEDGGQSWELRHESGHEDEYGWKISFPTPDTGYVSIEHFRFTDDGKVLKTTDGGQTWADVVIPGGGSLAGVGFVTGDVGWTSGHGVRSETTDGGATWTRYEGALGASVNRFRLFGDSLGYAFGLGVFNYEEGGETTLEPAPTGPPNVAVYPNPSTGRVTFGFNLRVGGHVELEIYDLVGRRVAVVADEAVAAGPHAFRWEGAGEPHALPTGTYIFRLTTGDGVESSPFIWVQR